MKMLPIALTACVLLMSGCTPSDQPPPSAEATPTASAGDEITEMDFESGEIDESATELTEAPPEPTPDVP